MPDTLTRSATDRLISLDVFRGLTVAGMVLVNNPGSWTNIYWPLAHANWNGWTPTDLIFPFFLFIVGVSITLALGRRLEDAHPEASPTRRSLYVKVARRSLIIFALGLFLNGFPYFHLGEIRIAGVLQRIAICYFCAALIFLRTSIRTQVIITVGLLLGYWLIMTLIPTPGFQRADYSQEGSIAAFVDRVVLGRHIWSQGKIYDPEGLLSTLPAIATTLMGVLTGHGLRTDKSPYEKITRLFIAGFVCLVAGWCWNPFFPINKSLWTSSYVLFTSGLALQSFALLYWLIDIRNHRGWTKPFLVFGVNAIVLFVGTGLMAKLMGLIKVSGSAGTKVSLKTWIYQGLFSSWASPFNASLAFAIAFVLLWLGIMWLLYRRRIFIRI